MRNEHVLYHESELNRILEENWCLLYGAGKVGRTVVKYTNKRDYYIDGILVSQMEGNPESLLGLPIYEIEKYEGKTLDKVLLVCVMEKLHDEIEKNIGQYSFKDVYYVSDKLFTKLIYANEDYEQDINTYAMKKQAWELEQRVEKKLEEQKAFMLYQKKCLLRFVPKPCLEYLVLNILDHCNLRCKGCDHFACIADPYYVSYKSICNDLDRMAELFHGDFINQIAVMGGEPLLHPDLLRILKAVREKFPYTIIRLTTNGLLLLKQSQEFWKVCRENDVTIVNTKYPINLDFEGMKEKAECESVRFIYYEDTGDDVVKKSFKKSINLKGNSNPVESFANCHISNYGNFLMEGKFFGCPFSCQSYRIFNKKYNQNLRLTEKDYLDIYQVKDMQEILEFCAKPKNYCRYCVGKTAVFDWSRSEKKMCEWVDE